MNAARILSPLLVVLAVLSCAPADTGGTAPPPPEGWTFDADVEGWTRPADPGSVNSAAVLSWIHMQGSPAFGALKIVAPLAAPNQYVSVVAPITPDPPTPERTSAARKSRSG